MTIKETIAEITTELKSYEESGLIDHVSLERWILNCLKRFGANAMHITEKIIEVYNGKSEIPENFYSLKLGLKCEPININPSNQCRDIIQTNRVWKEVIEGDQVWDNMSGSHIGANYKCKRESVYIRDCGCMVEADFRIHTPMKLTRGFNKEYATNKCENIRVKESPYEMNITRNTINFNFKEGFIYMQYYGLPTTEDGEIYIYDNPALIEYVLAHCRRKVLETLMYNNDDTNLATKIQIAKQEEQELFSIAMTTIKFEGLGTDWGKTIQAKNRLDMNKYDKLFRIN